MTPAKLAATDGPWTIVTVDYPVGLATIRFRKPVLGPEGVASHSTLLTVVWPYAEEGTGELPDEAIVGDMGRFENFLVDAVEVDGLAVLTAVFTLDGSRRWAFYTRDKAGFVSRLSTMPDYAGLAYPIKLEASNDPTWAYLREQILPDVDPALWK